MTWSEIYNAAMDKGINDPELKAKDTAREQVRNFTKQLGCDDLDEADCPEDEVERYCNAMELRFDGRGNIIDITLPDWVQVYMYHKMERLYLEQDIRKKIDDRVLDIKEITADELTETQMNEIVETYWRCMPLYNDTLEIAIEKVLS